MGYALPASIGAAHGSGKRVYSINGDGGFQMNIQELATIVRHNMDIKMILFVNNGYGMIRMTQDAYLGGKYEATDVESGLAFPDFKSVLNAYNIPVESVELGKRYEDKIQQVFGCYGPGCLIINVPIDYGFESF